jgi:hypothetical protein
MPGRASCRFDHGHEQRHEGHLTVTVRHDGGKAEVPRGGSHEILDARVVRQACEQLGLDSSQLPDPKSRVYVNGVRGEAQIDSVLRASALPAMTGWWETGQGCR